MKKLYSFSLFVLFIFLFFVSCKKQENDMTETSAEDLTIANAHNYFSSSVGSAVRTDAVASGQRNARKQIVKTPLWNKAYTAKLNGSTLVMIPVTYASPLYLGGGFSGAKVYLADNITRLCVYTDKQKNYHADLITYFPDSNYVTGGKFTGIIFVDDWSGNAITKYKMGKNNSILQWDGNFSTRPDPSLTQSDGSHSTDLVSIISVCNYVYGYNYSVDDPDNGYAYVEEVGCTYSITEEGDGGGYAGGGGLASAGGVGGAGFSSSGVVVAAGKNIIGNITDYDKCFTNTGGTGITYSVTVCVDQPIPGSRETWGFTPSNAYTSANPVDVGHTFMIFSEKGPNGTITRNIGLYPSGGVTPSSPSSPGQLNNDSQHEFDISVSVSTTSEQFFNMLNYVSRNATQPYNLNTNNCTSFAVRTLYAGDIYLPATVGSWPGGSGYDPGDLGEDIRTMKLGIGETRNTVSNPHPNLGTCN